MSKRDLLFRRPEPPGVRRHLQLAAALNASRSAASRTALAGKSMALVLKTGLRTRSTFALGITQLGGTAFISVGRKSVWQPGNPGGLRAQLGPLVRSHHRQDFRPQDYRRDGRVFRRAGD
jgi:hypothetical protein